MKAYYGQHWSTGTWAAWVPAREHPCGSVEQWGATEQEAKDNLCKYLRQHWDMTVAAWEKTSANEHC
jgi:hypothetical protein